MPSFPGSEYGWSEPLAKGQRPLHGYRIGDLDRGASSLHTFDVLDGQGPEGTLEALCLQEGGARVLSAGAGTGRQLYDLVDRVRARHPRVGQGWEIYGEAVDQYNFSTYSEYEAVRRAFLFGHLKYTQSGLEDYWPAQPFGLVTAYEVVFHNREHPEDIVVSLWRALGARGIAYFNADLEQDRGLRDILQTIRNHRWDVRSLEAELPIGEQLGQAFGTRPHQRRMNYRIGPIEPEPWLGDVLAPLGKGKR